MTSGPSLNMPLKEKFSKERTSKDQLNKKDVSKGKYSESKIEEKHSDDKKVSGKFEGSLSSKFTNKVDFNALRERSEKKFVKDEKTSSNKRKQEKRNVSKKKEEKSVGKFSRVKNSGEKEKTNKSAKIEKNKTQEEEPLSKEELEKKEFLRQKNERLGLMIRNRILQRRRNMRSLDDFLALRKRYRYWKKSVSLKESQRFLSERIAEGKHLEHVGEGKRVKIHSWKGLVKGPAEEVIKALGYPQPTPVQSLALSSRLIAKPTLMAAPTGTGKTLAYLIPLMVHLKELENSRGSVEGMAGVILPSHELCQQVFEAAKFLSHHFKLRVRLAAEKYDKADLLIGTPHKVMQVKPKVLVLDEADTLLGDSEFYGQLRETIAGTKHVTFVMATLTKMALKRAKKCSGKDLRVLAAPNLHIPKSEAVKHSFIRTQDKLGETLRLLARLRPPYSAIIFCYSAAKARRLHERLGEAFISKQITCSPSLLHGGLTSTGRASILAAFALGDSQVLVTTDLAARGWNPPSSLRLIIQFDFAGTLGEYLHRVGRLGRCKPDGTLTRGNVVSLITKRDAFLAALIRGALCRQQALSHPELRT